MSFPGTRIPVNSYLVFHITAATGFLAKCRELIYLLVF